VAGVESFTPSRNHVTTPVQYPQTPPAAGDHSPVWLNCGVYPEPVPDEQAVHSLEHGAVWVTYNPDLPAPVVASAWCRQLRLDTWRPPAPRAILSNGTCADSSDRGGGLRPAGRALTSSRAPAYSHRGTRSPSSTTPSSATPPRCPTCTPSQRGIAELEPGVQETFMFNDVRDVDLWRIVTVWTSREALNAVRASGQTPRGVLFFRAAGAEPTLSVSTVHAHARAHASGGN